jgi:RNA polymerase sigma-70 factor (ECF subfamily)
VNTPGNGIDAALPRLRRLAHALACDPVRGDALTKTAIAQAARDSDRLLRDARPDIAMFRILRRLWLDRLREFPDEEPPAGIGNIDEVMRALGALPPDQREAVALVVIEELDYHDAAEIVETTIEALAERLVAGRKGLAAELLADAN